MIKSFNSSVARRRSKFRPEPPLPEISGSSATTNESHSQKVFLISLLLIVAVFFSFSLQAWQADFPLPVFQTKKFFNTTFSDYYFYSQELQRNTFPLWNQYKGGGSTFLGEPQQNLFNPVNLLFLRILPFPQSLKFLYLLTALAAASGTFLYLRLLNIKPFFSLLGSVVFVFSGHFISQISDFPQFQGVSFLPWIFWQIHRLRQKPNFQGAILAGLILALQALSGPIGFVFLTWLLAFFYIVQPYFISTRRRSKTNMKTINLSIIYLFLAIILALGLSAVKLIPLRELALSGRKALTFFYSSSYPLKDLGSLINPLARVNFSVFIGVTPFLSIIIAFTFLRKQLKKILPFILFSLSVCLACLLLTIPQKSPLYIFYLFPIFNLTETPVVFMTFLTWFLVIIFALLLNLLFQKKRYLAVMLGIITLVELFIFNTHNYPSKSTRRLIGSLEENSPLIQKIRETDRKVWIVLSEPVDEIFALEPDNNLLWGIRLFNAEFEGNKRHQLFLALVHQGLEFNREKRELSLSPASQRLLALYSVKYLVTPMKVTNLSLIVQQSSFNFYEIPSSLPEKRVVDNIIIAETQKQLADFLQSREFDGSKSTVLEKQIQSKGVLTISQNYLPGWRAKFNNQTWIDVAPANLNQQAVSLENRNVDEPLLSFLPHSLKIGAIISSISLGFCFLIILGGYKVEKSFSSRLFFSK